MRVPQAADRQVAKKFPLGSEGLLKHLGELSQAAHWQDDESLLREHDLWSGGGELRWWAGCRSVEKRLHCVLWCFDFPDEAKGYVPLIGKSPADRPGLWAGKQLEGTAELARCPYRYKEPH